MTHPVFPWLTAPRRLWLYGVLTAANPLLIVHGITSDSTAPLWGALVLAVVGTGTAAVHVSDPVPQRPLRAQPAPAQLRPPDD